MINKLLSFLIIICVIYWLTVFFSPHITSRIESFIGLPDITSILRSLKKDLDVISTRTTDTVRDNTQEIVDTTKYHIDYIRKHGYRIEQWYMDFQNNLENLKDIYHTTSQKVEQVSDLIEYIPSFTGSQQQ